VDSERGTLEARLSARELRKREPEPVDLSLNEFGLGRELFEVFRANALGAEQGAMSYVLPDREYSVAPPLPPRLHEHFLFPAEVSAV
jgi:phosphogluconate dehydratase